MPMTDFRTWSDVIRAKSFHGKHDEVLSHFLSKVRRPFGFKPDHHILQSVLKSCALIPAFGLGKSLQSLVIKLGHVSCVSVSKGLLNVYAKAKAFNDCKNLFNQMPKCDTVAWNTVLAGLSGSLVRDAEVISLVYKMHTTSEAEFSPVTIAIVLPVCARLGCLSADSGCELEVVSLLNQMVKEGLRPDSITLLTLIRFYGNSCKPLKLKEAHGYLLRACHCQGILSSCILDAYGKCGNLDYARKKFQILLGEKTAMLDSMKPKLSTTSNIQGRQTDLLTWNLMIKAYVSNNHHEDAVSLLLELQQVTGMKPDTTTIMSILPMFTNTASANLLRQCHGYVIRACIGEAQLTGALIDVYSKCGHVRSAAKLFWSSSNKDLIMFTSLINGYAMHGMGKEALALFNHMLEVRMRPDHVVITSILSACSHTGLVDEGLSIFHSIYKVHEMKPTMEQYGCVVDLLARQGRVNDAFNFVTQMPVKPNATIWSILLGACRTYHEVELSKIVADHLLSSKDKDIGTYVTMSNLHAADSKWDGVLEIRKFMKTTDFKKPTGCSWM